MARKYRKLAILAKIEATYGVDPVPTGGANALLMTQCSITPVAGGSEERGLLTPTLGHQGVIPVGTHMMMEGAVEVAGAGAAGTVPAWGVLMRACGLSETVSAGVKVDYKPVSDGFESATIYYNADGVNHKLLGARGSFTADFTAQKIPRFAFKFTGLYGGEADAALPATTLTAFKKPVQVNKANSELTLHGVVANALSLSIDLGVAVEPWLNTALESIDITDRQATGRASIEATALATKNWFAAHLAMTSGAMAWTHGVTAGNIVEIAAPRVELGAPSQGQSQGNLTYDLPLMFTPNAGDDELVITVK